MEIIIDNKVMDKGEEIAKDLHCNLKELEIVQKDSEFYTNFKINTKVLKVMRDERNVLISIDDDFIMDILDLYSKFQMMIISGLSAARSMFKMMKIDKLAHSVTEKWTEPWDYYVDNDKNVICRFNGLNWQIIRFVDGVNPTNIIKKLRNEEFPETMNKFKTEEDALKFWDTKFNKETEDATEN